MIINLNIAMLLYFAINLSEDPRARSDGLENSKVNHTLLGFYRAVKGSCQASSFYVNNVLFIFTL